MTRVAQRESFGTSNFDHADLAFKGLRDRLLAKDEAGVTNSSFELLSSGRPFSEILSEAIATVRSAKEDANEAGQGEPRKPEITRGQDTPGADAPGHEPVSYENPPSQTPPLCRQIAPTRGHIQTACGT